MNSLMYTSEYDKMYHSEDKLWWYQCLRDLLKYHIGNYSSGKARILDAGCGTGKNIEFLVSNGYEHVEGFDYSADAIRFCRMRGLKQVQQGSVTAVDHPDSSFDIVYCMDVLGCLPQEERKEAVSELFRVLKPGGLFLCNSAALNIFRSQHDDVGNIKIRFTKKQFKALLQNEDREIVKLTYRILLLSPLVLVFKLTKNLLRIMKPGSRSQSDQVVFPLGINWLFSQVQRFENFLLGKVDLPFGSSVFIVMRKLDSSQTLLTGDPNSG